MGFLCRDMKEVWELTRWKEGIVFQAGGTAGEKALRLNATHLKNSLNDSSEPRAG